MRPEADNSRRAFTTAVLVLVLSLAGLLALPGEARADKLLDVLEDVLDGRDKDRERRERESREGERDKDRDDRRGRESRESVQFSLDAAVSKVRRNLGGKVIRAETRYSKGRPVHHIKLLTDEGRVRTVRVDGRSGRIQ